MATRVLAKYESTGLTNKRRNACGNSATTVQAILNARCAEKRSRNILSERKGRLRVIRLAQGLIGWDEDASQSSQACVQLPQEQWSWCAEMRHPNMFSALSALDVLCCGTYRLLYHQLPNRRRPWGPTWLLPILAAYTTLHGYVCSLRTSYSSIRTFAL